MFQNDFHVGYIHDFLVFLYDFSMWLLKFKKKKFSLDNIYPMSEKANKKKKLKIKMLFQSTAEVIL